MHREDGVFDPAHPDADVGTSYGYDALGRPSWTRDALGHYDALHYDAAGHVAWTLRNLMPVSLDAQGQPLIPATPPAFAPAQPDANVATLYGYDGLGRTVLVTQTGILTGTFTLATRTFSAATTRVTRTAYDVPARTITTTLDDRPDLAVGAYPDVNVQTVTQYDAAGNVSGQRDALSRWTYTQYDPLNRPVTTTVNYENGNPLTVDPAHQGWTTGTDSDLVSVTRYRPDSSVAQTIGNAVDGVFTATEPLTDRITQNQYDGMGRVITTTVNDDPATLGSRGDTNRASVAAYEATSGLLLGTRDALGRWVSEQYDALGRVTATVQNCRDTAGSPGAQDCASFDPTAPDRNVPGQTRYDALGRAVETVDALGHVTHTDFDGLGRALTVTQNYVAGGTVNADTNVAARTAYDALGRTSVETDAVGAATRYGYDGLGQTVAITDAAARTTRSSYDGTGMLRWSMSPDGRVTVLQVDGLGRVVATIGNYQDGVVGASEPADQDLATRTVYDAAGRRVQSVDAAGHVTNYGYDLRDHQTSVQNNLQSGTCSAPPCNVLTQYTYDRAGHRIAMTDPRGNTRRFSFDAADEQTASTDALTRTTTWDYDLGGRVTAQHDPRGSVDDLAYTYDGLDRVTRLATTNLPAPIQTTYDALGRRLSLADGTGTTSFGYDALGRTTVVTAPATRVVAYGYDAAGQRTSLRYPDSTTLGYSYDPDGQMQAVTQGGTTLASYAYDPAGRLGQVSRLNGAVTSYSYDGADRLRDLSTTVSGTLRSRVTAAGDRLGAPTVLTETLPLSGPAGWALPLPAPGIITTTAGTDSAGFSGDGGPATAAQLNSPHRLAGDGAGNLYIVDAANNRIRKIVASSGVITTVAGSGTAGYSGDGGAATAAQLNNPKDVAVDGAGTLFIADENNNRIRKVAAGTGVISTVAGTGVQGSSGDGGAATAAKLNHPKGVSVDSSGSLYIADTSNNRVRKVAAGTGVISTVAGTGTAGFSGDGGAATAAQLRSPEGTSLDAGGTLFVADTNNDRVRVVGQVGSAQPSTQTRVLTATYDGLQRLTAVTETPGTAFGYNYDLAGNRTDVLSNGVPLAHYDYDAADQVVGWGYDAAVNLLADGTRTALDLLGRNAASGRGRFHLTGQV